MRLRAKFTLGILVVFAVLGASIGALSIHYVNTNTIREARDRVRIYTRAAWEIHNGRIARMEAALETLARTQAVEEALRHPNDDRQLSATRDNLERIRKEQAVDVLSLLGPDGTVILRARDPYHRGDSLVGDPLVKQVIAREESSSGNIILPRERLERSSGVSSMTTMRRSWGIS
ncbi:MAG: hypothetical protein ACOC8C_02595, partial [Chloroflexota bacterium]